MKTPINQEELDKAARKQLKKDDFVEGNGITKILHSTYKGRTFWTNKAAIFFSEIPKKALEFEPKQCDPKYLDAAPFVTSTQDDLDVIPVLTFEACGTLGVVFLSEDEEFVTALDAKYFGYLVRTFGKELTYKTNPKSSQIMVYKNGEVVAAICVLNPKHYLLEQAINDKLYMARLKELATA